MKGKIRLGLFLLLLVSITGCSKLKDSLSEVMLDRSGILQDEEYLEYLKYRADEVLDENGYYKSDLVVEVHDDISEENAQGKVHVSFADNSYLAVNYYKDEECTKLIDQNDCYLNPGESIYAVLDEELHPESNRYTLNEFRVREFDSTGIYSGTVSVSYVEKGLVYQLPEHYTGGQIVILPIGVYPDAQVSLKVYTVDEKGEQKVLEDAGIWWINDKKCDSNNMKVSSVEPYTVKLDFDEENYFYVNAEPECFTLTPQLAGEVEFFEIEPNEEKAEYSVELHTYLTLNIESDDEFTYKENDGEIIKADDGFLGWGKGEKTFERLKYGDRITIETKGKINVAGDYRNIHFTYEKMPDGNRYVMTMVKSGEGNFVDFKTAFGFK